MFWYNFFIIMGMSFSDFFTFSFLFYVVLMLGNRLLMSPRLAIVNRWVRWVVFSLLGAYVLRWVGFEEKPMMLLGVVAFLVFFLVETVYTWVGIRSLNYSSANLFPRYRLVGKAHPWPTDRKAIMLKDFLRANKFEEVASVNVFIFEGFALPSTFFLDEAKTLRLQVLFVPTRMGVPSLYFDFTSVFEDGSRVITDNISMPFGGYYPEDWHLKRKPMCKSVEALMEMHKKSVELMGKGLVKWDEEVLLERLNEEQKVLEALNIEVGFLMPSSMHDVRGKITLEGRYRMWKEMWILKYFGVCM